MLLIRLLLTIFDLLHSITLPFPEEMCTLAVNIYVWVIDPETNKLPPTGKSMRMLNFGFAYWWAVITELSIQF